MRSAIFLSKNWCACSTREGERSTYGMTRVGGCVTRSVFRLLWLWAHLPETCDDTSISRGGPSGRATGSVTNPLSQLLRCPPRRSLDSTLTLRPSRVFTTVQGRSRNSLISILEGFGTKKVLIVTGKSLREKVAGSGSCRKTADI
jgi:hypothetical protein